jgi:hypothetical protein
MSAVLLADGRVLIVGGYAKTSGPYPTDAADLYDPSTGRFTPTGSLGVARADPSVTRLADGRVLVAGGRTWDGTSSVGKFPLLLSSDSAEIFDPVTGTFEPTGPMTGPRDSHSATLLDDGRVLLAGGWVVRGVKQGGSNGTTEFFE